MKIFFSAGEPSGDLHAANLIRQLRIARPDVEAVGYGGPEMARAGCQLHTDLTLLAVMWVARVLVNIHKFLALAGRADRYFRHQRPDAVVLIDYPGFNWWIARRAKAHGIPVFYYAPPQIWAWASWRVAKMRRFVDHVLCSLPFEARWFAEHGCNATFVGHPYFDEVRRQEFDEKFLREQTRPGQPLVTLLPGSRTQEVENNLHDFLAAARLIHARLPHVRFAVASFKPHQAEFAQRAVERCGLPIEVFVGRTPELIRLAECCLAVSGSVSLELLYQAKPTVILYRISRFGFLAQRFFRKVKHITLVNLLVDDDPFDTATSPRKPSAAAADAVLFPEYLTCQDRSEQIAGHVIDWFRDMAKRERLVERLASLRAEVGHGGASNKAAHYILSALDRRAVSALRPHFLPESINSRPAEAPQSAPARLRQGRAA